MSDFYTKHDLIWDNVTQATGTSTAVEWRNYKHAKNFSFFVKWTTAASITVHVDLSPLPQQKITPVVAAWLDPDDFYQQFNCAAVSTAAGCYVTLPDQMINYPFSAARFSFTTNADITAMYGLLCSSAL